MSKVTSQAPTLHQSLFSRIQQKTDADGGRDGKITFKGEQSGGEESTLAQIQSAHDGASDDEKADLIFKTNDGSDGAVQRKACQD